MKQILVLSALLIVLGVPDARANQDCKAAVTDTTIEAIYKEMHLVPCAKLQAASCTAPQLSGLEKWAFVATACKRDAGLHTKCSSLPACGPTVLAFDHDARTWRPIYGISDDDIDYDVNGIPKVLAGSGDQVVAVIESTNPLAYKVEPGAITETDAPVVADIKALFKVLGPALTALTSQADAPKTIKVPKEVDDVKKALAAITCLGDQWNSAQEFTQSIEDGKDKTYKILSRIDGCSQDREALKKNLLTLGAALDQLSRIDFCLPAVQALDLLLDTPPDQIELSRTRLKNTEIDTLSCQTLLDAFMSEINLDFSELEKAKANKVTTKQRWETLAGARRTELFRFSKIADAAGKAKTEGQALLAPDKQREIHAVLESIQRFEVRLAEHLATNKDLTSGVVEEEHLADFLVLKQGALEIAWAKTRARPLTISKSFPFEKLRLRRPDSLATSYGGASLRAFLTKMNVALTYTDITSPVYGMVSEAAPTATDPNAKRTVIGETDEESRIGKLAVTLAVPLFVRSKLQRRFSLEFGAGASTSTPALFLGLSARLGGGARLGMGYTYQQVKDLDGQSLGFPIAAASEIKQKNDWEGDFYASFSLSLESIGSLFNAP